MAERIRVRRDRPSALTWAVALALTMLAVYLATLGAAPAGEDAAVSADVRITREITFDAVSVHFADLGVHSSALQARIAASGLALRGAAGVVFENSDGFHVLGAGYALENDASRIAAQIGGQEDLETGVLSMQAEAVRMRITAPESAVEAILAADRTLRSQLDQTGTLALQADRGELSAASARTLAAVSRSELLSARKALESVDGAAEHPVCAGLMEQLSRLADTLGGVARGQDAGAALSGRLRCCHTGGMVRLIGFLNSLGS